MVMQGACSHQGQVGAEGRAQTQRVRTSTPPAGRHTCLVLQQQRQRCRLIAWVQWPLDVCCARQLLLHLSLHAATPDTPASIGEVASPRHGACAQTRHELRRGSHRRLLAWLRHRILAAARQAGSGCCCHCFDAAAAAAAPPGNRSCCQRNACTSNSASWRCSCISFKEKLRGRSTLGWFVWLRLVSCGMSRLRQTSHPLRLTEPHRASKVLAPVARVCCAVQWREHVPHVALNIIIIIIIILRSLHLWPPTPPHATTLCVPPEGGGGGGGAIRAMHVRC
jgi:hypothetical protein